MNDTEKLITIWKTNKFAPIENANINSQKIKSEVMDTIILFENREKTERTRQIGAAFALAILTFIFLYKVDLQTTHFIGLILLIIGTTYAIIANKTDNFPDIRQLSTIDYLHEFKENTLKRTKMHIINTIASMLFLVPGCYLTFKDSFPELGMWWIPIMVTTALFTSYFWFQNYRERSNEVVHQVSELIEEFHQEK